MLCHCPTREDAHNRIFGGSNFRLAGVNPPNPGKTRAGVLKQAIQRQPPGEQKENRPPVLNPASGRNAVTFCDPRTIKRDEPPSDAEYLTWN